MIKWIIIAIILVVLVLIFLAWLGEHSEHADSDQYLYNLNNDTAYRKGVYRQINTNFRPHIERLYKDIKVHKNISTLKGRIGAINTQYNNRVTQQNIETGKRRDYIGTHFGSRGKRWRDRIMAKHSKI